MLFFGELIPLSQTHLHPVKTSTCSGEHLFVVSKSLQACISPEVEIWLLDPWIIFCYPPSKQFDGCKQHSSTGRSLQPQQWAVQFFLLFKICSNSCTAAAQYSHQPFLCLYHFLQCSIRDVCTLSTTWRIILLFFVCRDNKNSTQQK